MKKEKLELLLNKLSTSYNAIIIKIILLKDEELLNILVDINELLFDEANVKFLKEKGYTDALNKYPEGSDINPNEFLKEVRPDFVKGAKSIIESINPKFLETLPKDYFNTFNTGIPKKRKRFNRK